MQITSVGGYPAIAPSTQGRMPEKAERGPDHDNDGDESGAAVATKSLPTPPPGRGGSVDMLA